MNKAALFTMLATQAPKLLALLQNSGSAEMLPNITSALDNGYDPALIEQTLGTSEFPVDVDALYNPERGLEKGFPSDFSSGLDVINIAEGNRFGENPAEISAGNMLAQGIPSDAEIPPYPGGLSEIDHLSNEIDGLPNSSYKTSLVEEMNRKAKPTKLADVFNNLLGQKAYNK